MRFGERCRCGLCSPSLFLSLCGRCAGEERPGAASGSCCCSSEREGTAGHAGRTLPTPLAGPSASSPCHCGVLDGRPLAPSCRPSLRVAALCRVCCAPLCRCVGVLCGWSGAALWRSAARSHDDTCDDANQRAWIHSRARLSPLPATHWPALPRLCQPNSGGHQARRHTDATRTLGVSAKGAHFFLGSLAESMPLIRRDAPNNRAHCDAGTGRARHAKGQESATITGSGTNNEPTWRIETSTCCTEAAMR